MKNLLLVLATGLLLLTPASSEVIVYVSESGDNCIALYSLDETTGDLSRVGEVDPGGSPGPLALSPDGKFLYAAVRNTKQFATFSRNPSSGELNLVVHAPAPGSAPYIFAEPSGQWLLAAYYGDGIASVSRIVDGVVTGDPVSVIETGKKAHCIRTDPSNRFAFVPHTGELNKVEQLLFDVETGKLSSNDPPHLPGGEGHGPRHLKFHPNGRWVYQVNEQGKSVTLCDFDPATGTLSMRQTLSTVPPDWDPAAGSCAELLISKDGKFVYASNRGHDSLAIFSLSPENGKMTSLGQVATEKTPRSFHLIPDHEAYVIAAGQGSDTLAVYRRDPEAGTLTQLSVHDCGKSPAWVMGVRLVGSD